MKSLSLLLILLLNSFQFSLQDVLLSENMAASQSSTHAGYGPQRAVDGNNNQQFGGNSCTHTVTSTDPWWQVTLPGLAHLSSVTVYNRGDCCGERLNGFKVLVSNTTNGAFWECAEGPQTTVTNEIIHRNCDAYARVVRIKLYGASRTLTLCEVKVYGVLANNVQLLSENMPVSQSSTHAGYGPRRAVDGNINRDFAGNSCTHTVTSTDPWWQVYLADLAYITSVVVYNRGDCCGERLNGFNVLTSQTVNGQFFQCAAGPQTTATNEIIQVNCDCQARIVRIQLSGANTVLTLCEVKVYGTLNNNVRLLSEGMAASQSSTHAGYDAPRAVDGNINQQFGGNSCTHTVTSTDTWWQVYMPGLSHITSVTVYNRGDCCGERLNGFKVLASQSGSSGPFAECAAGPQTTTTNQVIHLYCNANANVVRIQIYGASRVLTLCEVKVYGVSI